MIVLFIVALLAAFLAMPVFLATVLGFVALNAARDESLDEVEEKIETPTPVVGSMF